MPCQCLSALRSPLNLVVAVNQIARTLWSVVEERFLCKDACSLSAAGPLALASRYRVTINSEFAARLSSYEADL